MPTPITMDPGSQSAGVTARRVVVSEEKIEMPGEAERHTTGARPPDSVVDDYRFLTLVMSLGSAAWAQLGKVPHPVTQKIEKDIDQARISIEFLRMLQEKTEGNLSVKEQEMLDNLVSDLELNFADEVRKSEASAEKATEKKGPDIIIPPGVSKGPEIIKP